MERGVVATWLALMLALASHPVAQSAAGPTFEVASVKTSDPNAVGPFGKPPPLPATMIAPGRFVMSNSTLSLLVKTAYDFWFDFRIVGGPEWLMSRRFDIQATSEHSAADIAAMRPMLRTLLADRFKLKVHTEKREMPIYALVVARDDRRLGPKVKTSPADCSNPAPVTGADLATLIQAGRVPCAIMPFSGGATLRANGASMAALAESLTSQVGRWVEDRTGLSGLYDWEMTYDRRATLSPEQQSDSTSANPILTTALQEQLGLKLEPTRGSVEVLVIDSAAMPEPD